MRLHIIIPVVNEADNLAQLLPLLLTELPPSGHITVADGGSTDHVHRVVAAYDRVTHLACASCGRARQMNEAAARRPQDFDVLYFVHADTRPPRGFYQDIVTSVEKGYPVGCYRFRFDMLHPLLAINAYCTRFSGLACRGGDQSLYVTTATWRELDGFRDMKIMEDYDIIERVWAREIPFRVMPRSITVSARKYRVNGWLRVQLANLRVFQMYRAGADEEAMVQRYRSMLKPW